MSPTSCPWWLVVGVTLASGCQTEGDFFFLRREGAVMPVWVRGNLESGTYVLLLHGGPGNSAQSYVDAEAFQALEQDYAVVYWDQRGAGNAQGNPSPETLTLDQYVADTEAVVRLLRSVHDVRSFFVLGHSWGGGLAPAWLIDPAHQEGVDGMIVMDGAFDLVDGLDLSRRFVVDYATARVAEGTDVETWQGALDWAVANPVIEHEDIGTLGAYVTAARGYYWNPENADGPTFERLFLSPENSFAELHDVAWSQANMDVTGIDLTADMASIEVPSLVTWGRHDGILPVPLAQRAFDALGTPAEAKEQVVFEDSAHSPYAEEPDAWLAAVTSFVDRWRGGGTP